MAKIINYVVLKRKKLGKFTCALMQVFGDDGSSRFTLGCCSKDSFVGSRIVDKELGEMIKVATFTDRFSAENALEFVSDFYRALKREDNARIDKFLSASEQKNIVVDNKRGRKD